MKKILIGNETEKILGCKFFNSGSTACVNKLIEWVRCGTRCKYLICVNPHSVEVSRNDVEFQRAINNADLVTPDGFGIVLASILLGGTVRKRVTGSDIFFKVNMELNKIGGCRAFFLGSTPKNLERISNQMKADFPNINVVGTFSPPFKQVFSDEDNQHILKAVSDCKPDILWVGMTAPKQEKWIFKNRDRLDVKFACAVGAVFDFYTKNVKRPHPFFQRIGLEWLPRFLREPRRLWRRNIVSAPVFLLRVLKTRLKNSL